MENLASVEGFDWDEGNRSKNWVSDRVMGSECETVFFNQPLVIMDDVKHSAAETRYYAFGKTDLGRTLLIVFCVRKNRIRVISAKDMDKKEKRFYEGR